MKIATWNVNSVRARLANLLAWLEEAAPDVALLQVEQSRMQLVFSCIAPQIYNHHSFNH